MAKMSFNRNFALAREIIHGREFSFYAIFLHEHDDLLSRRSLVTFYNALIAYKRKIRIFKFCGKIITSVLYYFCT